MTADKLEAVPDPEPALLPGRKYFTYTFEDWDGNQYSVRLKDIGWMPKEIIDIWLGGDNNAPLRWGASDEDYAILQKIPRRELENLWDEWGKDAEVSPGESPSSPSSSPTVRSGRRSKPT